MKPRLTFRPAAAQEVRDARRLRQDDLVRRALLHDFPYSLVYEIISNDELVVLACRHVRRDELDLAKRHRDV